jgi:6-phospho-3-hexuloisomerase
MKKNSSTPNMLDIVHGRLDAVAGVVNHMRVADAEKLIKYILAAKRVFVTGKGRSGKIAECFSVRLMQMGFDVHIPGEATCPRIKRGDLMIAISCSGTTMTTVELSRITRSVRARVVALTAVPDSPLADSASMMVIVPTAEAKVKPSYRCVLGPLNNTLFEETLLMYFDAMVYSILEREGIPKQRLAQLHTNLE